MTLVDPTIPVRAQNSVLDTIILGHAQVLNDLLMEPWEIENASWRAWRASYIWADGTVVRAALVQQRYGGKGNWAVSAVTRCDKSIGCYQLSNDRGADLQAACVFLGLDDMRPSAVTWRMDI